MQRKIKMALYDSGGDMIPLVNYLCKNKQEIVETRLFTNPGMLRAYVEEGRPDILLAREEEECQVGGYLGIVPEIVLLTEGNLVREQGEYLSVFRYQSAEEMVREILEAVAEDDRIVYQGAPARRRRGELLCGYSPFGGAGLTSFLIRRAKELSGEYRTLYVSLEAFHGLADLPPLQRKGQPEEYRGMSEVIFYLQQRRDKLSLKLESLVFRREQLEYLLAVDNYRDLHLMTRGDMEYFLQVLSTEAPYERIVFDLGYLGEAEEYLLEQCDRIYMPRPGTEAQEMKRKSCEQSWVRQGNSEILNKIVLFDAGEAGG